MQGGPLLALFPDNGLDRSLHAPVLIGLCILTFFTETLGWSYVGLVVAGYLATVFIAAPVTGLLVAMEAVLTYLLAAGLGRWLTKSGAWSDVFGRERFFLFILGAVVVRLAVEGSLVPWIDERFGLPHSRELYSLGLVLVPLLANMFWNSGLLVAAPRVAVVTGLTWAAIAFVLLPYTNFTISRFQIANESVSLAFLESPHAHIILLFGALLGARNNVRYGWDYNGILVPALLGVAWYQPTKLATTVAEALLVYALARALAGVRPFSRLQIVGPRRTLFAYTVGFGVKVALGFALGAALPSLQMVDYFGFGYLLPTLLAVKMWNRSSIGTVIMPTLQVSLTAFLVGNAAGFGLAVLAGGAPAEAVEREVVREGSPVALELLLGDSAPRPDARDGEAAVVARRIAAEVADRGQVDRTTLALARRSSLRIRRDGSWTVITPRVSLADEDVFAPRAAFRRRGAWMIVASGRTADSPIAAVAAQVADLVPGGARAIVLRSRHASRRERDEAFAEGLGIARVLRVEDAPRGEHAALSLSGTAPPGLDVVGLGRALGLESELRVVWRRKSGASRWRFADAPLLLVPRAESERIGARALGAPDVERWPGALRPEIASRLTPLTSVGGRGYRGPTIEELRLFGSGVAPVLLSLGRGEEPGPWPRALAARLGYRFVRVRDDAWGLVEPPSPHRRGNASWFVRTGGGRLGVEMATARWEVGVAAAGMALYEALDAGMVLLAGSMPGDHPLGLADMRRTAARRSFFESAHEIWLERSGMAVAVQGIAPDRPSSSDVVLSFGREAPGPDRGPAWTLPLARRLEESGLDVRAFDGTAERAPFEGSAFVALAHAVRFAPDRMAVVWMSPALRGRFARIAAETEIVPRLARLGAVPLEADVGARALSAIGDREQPAAACDPGGASAPFEAYLREKNPFDLVAGLRDAGACRREVLRDARSGAPWILLSGSGRARLVPLAGGPPSLVPAMREAAEVSAAVQLGLASFTVEGPP